jgi:predicted DNA-binding protein
LETEKIISTRESIIQSLNNNKYAIEALEASKIGDYKSASENIIKHLF